MGIALVESFLRLIFKLFMFPSGQLPSGPASSKDLLVNLKAPRTLGMV